MKYIRIPEDVDADGVTVTFVEFVQQVINEKPFGEGRRALRAADRIEELATGRRAGDVLGLEDADHELLARVVDTMSYLPRMARRLRTFQDAICDHALSKMPE